MPDDFDPSPPTAEPSQEDLDRLFDQSVRINIHWWSGGMDGYEPATAPHSIESAEGKEALRSACRISGGTTGACLCIGDGALDFVDTGGGIFAQLSIHHASHVRLEDHWRTDGALIDGPGLMKWLVERGVVRKIPPVGP